MNLHDVLSASLTPEQLHASVRRRMRAHNPSIGIDLQQRAAFVRAAVPEAIPDLLHQADLARDGMLILPGTEGRLLFVGNPPAWHRNPTADEEYVWGLNRMEYWPTLLRAYTISGDASYARKVVTELEDWITACPCPPINTDPVAARVSFYAVTPWRSLEAGIRMFQTWPQVIVHLIDSEFLTPDLLARMVISLHEHGRVLAEICPVFWPRADHNHYLMENLGLLTIAVMVPELAKADAWFQHAVRELERCAMAQLTIDGGQIEACPSYHNGCVYWFCRAMQLADIRNPGTAAPFSKDYLARVARSAEYTVHSARPTGVTVPWGDSDPTDTATDAALWWYNVSGDAAPFRTLAGLTGMAHARGKIFDMAWSLRHPAKALEELNAPAPAAPPRVYWSKGLDQVALRSSWNRDASSVFFACRSPVNNGHAHVDPMGFDFCALGQAMLVDPGRYTYRNCPERIRIKSALFHNTITVDRREPFESLSGWHFSPQQPGRITHVWELPRLLASAAIQANFQPAVHRRLVALVDDRCLLVLDDLSALKAGSSVQLYFHADTTDVHWNTPGQSAQANFLDTKAILAFAASDSSLTGQTLDGKVSDAIDVWRDSHRLMLEDVPTAAAPGKPRRCYAAVVLPARRSDADASIAKLRVWHDSASVQCAWKIGGKLYQFTWSENSVAIK